MATYAIGDLQGCFADFQRLLHLIGFDDQQDRLWLAGDLVNRGPDSLACLRFVRQLGERAITVLGNHDLHLLATAHQVRKDKDHSLHAILEAPDRDTLLNWLRQRPLLHHDTVSGFTLVHAGIPPQWDLAQAKTMARELEATLRGNDYVAFLKHMYGNQPDHWSESLSGMDRLRFICNSLTRLRYCTPEGQLRLKANGPPGTQPEGEIPWFDAPRRRTAKEKIVFGHWSTLGLVEQRSIYSLDTGCVWGGQLTALRLDPAPLEYFQVNCQEHKRIS